MLKNSGLPIPITDVELCDRLAAFGCPISSEERGQLPLSLVYTSGVRGCLCHASVAITPGLRFCTAHDRENNEDYTCECIYCMYGLLFSIAGILCLNGALSLFRSGRREQHCYINRYRLRGY